MRILYQKGFLKVAVIMLAALSLLVFFGCSGGASASEGSASNDDGSTSGSAYTAPNTILLSPYSSEKATGTADAAIDVSSISQGYVAAIGISSSRLKLQVKKGDLTYNYDMPNNGTPVVAPLNMGDGAYQVSVMQNTTESRYITLCSVDANVVLESEFAPFLRPNVFCEYTENSPVVAKARELVSDAENEGDALRSIYQWIVNNVTYDKSKASELAGKTGYIPNPEETLASQTGICFDYASLAAAMLRSQGIPCKIITGYVAPNGIYHAWNEVWIDGSWKTIAITVNPQTWTRVDTTFAAGGDTSTVGDGSNYENRYVY